MDKYTLVLVHEDTDRKNNKAYNLCWVTLKENQRRSIQKAHIQHVIHIGKNKSKKMGNLRHTDFKNCIISYLVRTGAKNEKIHQKFCFN